MWFRVYAVVAALMVLGGILIWLTRIFDEHTVFALEAYEIAFFALYWIARPQRTGTRRSTTRRE